MVPTRRAARCAGAGPPAGGLKAALDGYDSLLTLDSPTAWAAFLLWSVPLPAAIGAILTAAEQKTGPAARAPLESIEQSTDKPLGVQRNLMWAFPSFSCFLKEPEQQPPLDMPSWQKWALFLNSWAGLAWYLNYKCKIEDELKAYFGKGLSGTQVVAPFAAGFTSGILGEYLYGSLELPPFSDLPSTLFWGGFAWIYVMQFVLYSSVNKLYASKNLQEPLLTWGLLVPGYNFVTGIRQIHFLSKFWAMERGEPMQPDAFCEMFPFSTKEQLGVVEFFSQPELWLRWDRLGLETPTWTDLRSLKLSTLSDPSSSKPSSGPGVAPPVDKLTEMIRRKSASSSTENTPLDAATTAGVPGQTQKAQVAAADMSFSARLEALAAERTERMSATLLRNAAPGPAAAPSASAAPAAPADTDLAQFRRESVEALKKELCK